LILSFLLEMEICSEVAVAVGLGTVSSGLGLPVGLELQPDGTDLEASILLAQTYVV
jgi:hypothetical protein